MEHTIQMLVDSFCGLLRQKVPFASPWILEALRRVPRHLFIDQYYDYQDGRFVRVAVDGDEPGDSFLKLVYGDNGLMIRHLPRHSAASQPALVVAMLHHLDLRKGLKVLEIGTGSGWNAGLLSFGVGDDALVYSIDIQEDLVEEARRHLQRAGFPDVNLLAADGGKGWSRRAPFDRIMATVGCPDIPPAWLEQLAEGGILLVPLKTAPVGDPLLRLQKQGRSVSGGFVGPSGFMTLQGACWSDTEDVLSPPWGARIDTLLAGKPTTVTLSYPVDLDVLFFAYLSGMRLKSLVDWGKKQGLVPALFDLKSDTIYVPGGGNATVKVYGDPAHAQDWSVLLEQWSQMGKPRFTDYVVELAHPETAPTSESSWTVQRAHQRYRFTLRRVNGRG